MSKDTYQTARCLLADAATLLIKIHSPIGPNQADMTAAIEIMEIAKKLGADERLQTQLNRVDEALGWCGSGQGRIDFIKALQETDNE